MLSNLIGFALTVLLVVSVYTEKTDECNQVIITSTAPGCDGWGIRVADKKYPSPNLPEEFKQDGLNICAVYKLHEDKSGCVCCSGMWADILSMEPVK